MTDTRRLWMLGASDPEMSLIEELLLECGEHVAHALDESGERVNPRTAYDVRGSEGGVWMPEVSLFDFTTGGAEKKLFRRYSAGEITHTVECDGPHLLSQNGLVRIDHHRPGDAGYGRGPEEFFAASSIGQVVRELERLGALPITWKEYVPGADSVRNVVYGGPDGSGRYRLIPYRLVVAAACDHCLGHAYAGRCQGVTRDDVLTYRAECAASDPYHPVDAVEFDRDVQLAVDAMERSPVVDLTPDRPEPLHGLDTPFVPRWSLVRDMRAAGYVSQLPDAACYAGEAYITEIADRDGRRKLVLGGATTPEHVRAFLGTFAERFGLTGCYGDPARGFAGGYLQ